jgi:hypothetical protein
MVIRHHLLQAQVPAVPAVQTHRLHRRPALQADHCVFINSHVFMIANKMFFTQLNPLVDHVCLILQFR